MADRINVTTGTVAGLQSPAGPRAGRFIALGQTQFGPTDAPRVATNLRDYMNTYGARSGGASMYDAAETFFACGGSELVVQRASGPSAVLSTITLDSKIVVTSRWPGAYYDAFTATFTHTTNTLTVTKPSGAVSYVGATAAALQAAASVDPDVTVTVSALPSSSFGPTALASGADDYANVVWATVLGKITPAVGPGCIAAPGVNAAAAALASHAYSNRRLALLTPVQTDAAATVISAQGSITAAHKVAATYVYPWVTVPDGTGGRKVIDGVAFAAGLRAVTQRVYGVGTSPLLRAAHQLVAGADAQPLTETDDTTHTSLLAAGVATIRTLPNAVGLDVWATPTGVGSNARLAEAIYRDMVDSIADECATLLDQFIGQPATALVLASVTSALKGVVETSYAPYLVGGDGVGYKVAVSNGADPADNRISAVVSLKFAEEIGFVDLVINAASANQTI